MLKDNGLTPMRTLRTATVSASRPTGPPSRPPRTHSQSTLRAAASSEGSSTTASPSTQRKPLPLPPGVSALSVGALVGAGPKPLPAGYSKNRAVGPPPLPLKQSSTASRRTIQSSYHATPDKPLQSMGAHRYQPPQDTALRMQPPPRPHRPRHVSLRAPQPVVSASTAGGASSVSPPSANAPSPSAAPLLPGLRQPKFRRRPAPPPSGGPGSRFTVPRKPPPRPTQP
jgi:hypothetical protein